MEILQTNQNQSPGQTQGNVKELLISRGLNYSPRRANEASYSIENQIQSDEAED